MDLALKSELVLPVAAPAPPPAQVNRLEKGGEDAPARNVENSPFENLGYNSGDDVSRYSDDHLNKQLIVKPNTVLAKDGSEDEENAAVKVEEPAKPAEQTPKTTEEKKVEEAIVPKVEETKGEETACLEQKMPDCMLEQQKGVTLEQQQQVQQQHQQTPMQPPQPLSQQQNAAQQYVPTMEQCAVAQQQKQLEQQQAALEQQQKQQQVLEQQQQLEQQQAALEQQQKIEQQQVLEQQQQQQQSWGDSGMQGVGYYGDGGDGSQSYPGGQVPTGQEGQFYTGEPSKDSTQQQ